MRPLLWATVVARDISHVHTMPTVEGIKGVWTRTAAFSVFRIQWRHTILCEEQMPQNSKIS